MSQYMLLLYENRQAFAKMSPEEMQKATEKYMAWAKNSFYKDSKRLGMDYGKVLQPDGAKPKVSDGPYSETKEALGGFYLIEAANYDEAVERSKTHPHLEYGGVIEVRELWAM